MPLLRLATLVATAASVLLGVWVASGVISNDFRVSMALTGAWFAIAGAAAAAIAWRFRPVRAAVLIGYVVTAGAVGAYLGLTTLRDRVVDEQVVTGVPATAPAADPDRQEPRRVPVEVARGGFRSHEHTTRGRAAVVRLPDGRRFLTLTRFATSAGPDLRVRLVPGDTADGGTDGNVDLGALKGNKGDQQYAIPRGARVGGRTVVIWCRAFSAPFGSARLRV
jgi:hypothetical protein